MIDRIPWGLAGKSRNVIDNLLVGLNNRVTVGFHVPVLDQTDIQPVLFDTDQGKELSLDIGIVDPEGIIGAEVVNIENMEVQSEPAHELLDTVGIGAFHRDAQDLVPSFLRMLPEDMDVRDEISRGCVRVILSQFPVHLLVDLDAREVGVHRDGIQDELRRVEGNGDLLCPYLVYLHEGREVFDEFLFGGVVVFLRGEKGVVPFVDGREGIRVSILFNLGRLHTLVAEA